MSCKNIIELNNKNFDLATSQGVVLVGFFVPWSTPCLRQNSILKEVAEKTCGQVRIFTANVNESISVASQFQVKAFPMILLFKDGNLMQRFIGVQSMKIILDSISQLSDLKDY